MSPKIREIVDYLKVAHPQSTPVLADVIADCAARGFSPVQIMAGISLQFGVSLDDAKPLVASHPVWGATKVQHWKEFHDDLEKALNREVG